MGQRILKINLDLYSNEDDYNKFKKNKEKLLILLSCINRYISKVNGNLYYIKLRRERLIEKINNMNIKLESWKKFNIPEREVNITKLPDLD
tara:strand:+ start:996 stop:1268 length:273 start_codon:yes stop_codon:yes gene_type:complete